MRKFPQEIPVGPCDTTILLYRKPTNTNHFWVGHLEHANRRTDKMFWVDRVWDPTREDWIVLKNTKAVHIDEIYAVEVTPEQYRKLARRVSDQINEREQMRLRFEDEMRPIRERRTKALVEMDGVHWKQIQAILD